MSDMSLKPIFFENSLSHFLLNNDQPVLSAQFFCYISSLLCLLDSLTYVCHGTACDMTVLGLSH